MDAVLIHLLAHLVPVGPARPDQVGDHPVPVGLVTDILRVQVILLVLGLDRCGIPRQVERGAAGAVA